MPADHGRNIQREAALQALVADLVVREDVPVSVHGLDLAPHDLVDSEVLARVVPAVLRLRVRLRVHSVRLDAHAVATSSIRRPRKAR